MFWFFQKKHTISAPRFLDMYIYIYTYRCAYTYIHIHIQRTYTHMAYLGYVRAGALHDSGCLGCGMGSVCIHSGPHASNFKGHQHGTTGQQLGIRTTGVLVSPIWQSRAKVGPKEFSRRSCSDLTYSRGPSKYMVYTWALN